MKMRPIVKASIVGVITVIVYLSVVIVTTPALPADAAISAAFEINSIVIVGMGLGIGIQIYLSEQSKRLGCTLNVKKKAFGGNSSGTLQLQDFFHFFHWYRLDVVDGGYTRYHYCQVF